MKKSVVVLLVISLALIISCDNNSSLNRNLVSQETSASFNKIEPAVPASEVITDRKIIRNGNVTFETRDINATRAAIEKVTKELRGFIARENALTFENKIQHTLELRVPEANFDLLISKVTENAVRVDNKDIGSQDVTEEFIDIEARLKTKKELEGRYLELLKKASKVDEILSIEKEIGALQSDIESIEGRLKYLNDRVSLSELTVTYYQKIKAPFQFSSKFTESLKGGWRNMLWFFIGLINLWPFIIIGLIILIIFLRINRNKRNQKNK